MGRARMRKIDRLSSLPEELLLHILTFLPVKDAVKTSLVAPKFRNLWAFLPTLSFDFCRYHNCRLPRRRSNNDPPQYKEDFFHFVYSLLLLHQGKTIDKFHLKLELSFYYQKNYINEHRHFAAQEKRTANAVTSWIIFALSKKVKFIHLDFISCRIPCAEASYILPMDVFSKGESFKELRLSACQIKLQPQVHIQFNSLRKLFFKEIVLDNNIMDRILRACTVLEELSLLKCHGLSRLAFSNPSIKSLDVQNSCPRLEIICPNIVSLVLSGYMRGVVLVDVSSVANASLFCNWSYERPKVKTLLEKFRQCKNFTICPPGLQPIGLSFEWRHLVLDLMVIGRNNLPGTSYLLRSCPFLESLDFHICSKSPDILKDVGANVQAFHLDRGEVRSLMEGDFHCLQHHLKIIRIYGDVTGPNVFDFIEFLLKNALVLEKLEICSQRTFRPLSYKKTIDLSIEEKLDGQLSIEKKLMCSFPRASSKCEFFFSW